MNGKIVWSSIVFIIAFALPTLVGVAVTGNGYVLWGFASLFLTFLFFWISYEDSCRDLDDNAMLASAYSTLAFGVILTVIFAVTGNPYAGWVTLVMSFVSMIIYRIV